MGYVLEGGPRDGEYADEVPSGYVAKGVDADSVTESSLSPRLHARWVGTGRLSPKDQYTQQLADEEYESLGEGARRELFGD